MGRRGENIFKRKDGYWEARYVKGYDEYGKKKYASVYAKSYREVKEKRLEIISQITLMPQSVVKRTITLSALVLEWLYLNQNRLKPSTYQKYDYIYHNHIENQIGKYQVIYLTPIVVKQFSDEKLASGLSATTVNGILVFIKTCLKYGSRQYALPMIDIIYLKRKRQEMRVLSVEEQRKLTNYLIKDMDIYKLGVLVALYTGVRIGELCALQWKDIKDGVMTTNKSMQRLRKGTTHTTEIIVSEPKSESSFRVIPIPIFINEEIEKFRLSDEQNFMSKLYHPVIEPRVMQYQFKKYLKDCNLEDASFHCLRHTYATRCVEQMIDLKTLSVLLGHSDISVTGNRYVHSSFDQKIASINKLKFIV